MKKLITVYCMSMSAICSLVAETETVDGYTWTYRITGDAAEIYGHYYKDALNRYTYIPSISPKPIGHVVIPSTLGGKIVVSIGEHAFRDCSELTSVTIPACITNIGGVAFLGCSSLTRVYIADLAAWCRITFGDNPLKYAHDLYLNDSLITDLRIPDGVTSIGDYAFSGCSSLSSVTVSDSVTNIGSSAFSDCGGLASVTISSGVKTIEDWAFSGCSGLTSDVFWLWRHDKRNDLRWRDEHRGVCVLRLQWPNEPDDSWQCEEYRVFCVCRL